MNSHSRRRRAVKFAGPFMSSNFNAVKTSIVGPIKPRFGAVAPSVWPYALNGRQNGGPTATSTTVPF
jgi:hypothetical protein